MAIDINRFELPMTPQNARDFIQRNTDNFGVFFDVDRCFELSAIMQLEMVDTMRKLRRLSSNPKLNLDDKQSVINTLIDMGVNKAEFFDKTKQPSFNEGIRDSILTNVASA